MIKTVSGFSIAFETFFLPITCSDSVWTSTLFLCILSILNRFHHPDCYQIEPTPPLTRSFPVIFSDDERDEAFL